MKKTNSKIVAERHLHSIGEAKKDIWVKIGMPERTPDGANFLCRCEITGYSDKELPVGAGVDSVQALISALFCINAFIDCINKTEYGGKLRWGDDANCDLGFHFPDQKNKS